MSENNLKGQTKFAKNFTSLMEQLNDREKNIFYPLMFCNLFQSDDINLFEKFKQKAIENKTFEESIDTDTIIGIYAEQYGLNPENDMDKILQIYVNNAINEGVVFHLSSNANRENILKKGLGIEAIGEKTEETEDYDKLVTMAGEDLIKKLNPFHNEKEGPRVYYSDFPIPNSRYGERPEWLLELKLNSSFVDFGQAQDVKAFADQILSKYDEKYSDKGKSMFMFPFPDSRKEKMMEYFSSIKDQEPKECIELIHSLIQRKDNYCEEWIPGSTMVAVNLNDYNIYLGESLKDELSFENSHETENTTEKNDNVAENISLEFRKKLETASLDRRSSEITEDFEAYMQYLEKGLNQEVEKEESKTK